MKKAAPAIIDINLLPREQRPAEITPLQAAGIVLAVAAVVGLAPLSLMTNGARDEASSAQRQADATEQRLGAVQVELTAARGLRYELEEANAQIAKLTEKQGALQGGARPLSHDLPAIWGSDLVPADTRITRVQESIGGFTVLGVAPGPLEAIAYAQTLVDRAGFAGASMASFAPGTAGGVFTIEVTR